LSNAAVTVGLPFLASLGHLPRRARAAECAPRKRFVAWYQPNGFVMPHWTPEQTGAGYIAPSLLEPLAPVRAKSIILSGLENEMVAQAKGMLGNHAGGTGCFLTQVRADSNVPERTSLDQKIAARIGACTSLPSLQLGMEPSISAGSCDGAPCSFSRGISWANNTPLANVYNPAVAFDRMFAGVDPRANDADIQRRRALRSSVLDHATRQASALSARLARLDRIKLDEYLTGVRELELRIQKTASPGSGVAGQCAMSERPPEKPQFRAGVDIMTDLMVLALRCDATRVITFMISSSFSGRDYTYLGAGGSYHNISHHMGDPANLEKLRKIGRWQVEKVAALAAKLDAIDDGQGKTVLDNTCVFFSSEIADGDRHNHWDLPVLLMGGLGGTLKGLGQHISYTKYTFPRPLLGPQGGRSIGDLFVSIQNGFGISDTRFGANGTRPLAEIMA